VGGDGNDTLSGGAGNDTLSGGAGDDTIDLTDAPSSRDVVLFGGGLGEAGSLEMALSLGFDTIVGLNLGSSSTQIDTLRFSEADFLINGAAALGGSAGLDGNFYIVASAPNGTPIDLNGSAAGRDRAIVFVGSGSGSTVQIYFTVDEGSFSLATSVQIASLVGVNVSNLGASDLAFG